MKKMILKSPLALLMLAVWMFLSCGGNSDNEETLESVIVDLMTGLSAPADDFVTVSLRDHDPIYLDMTKPNATARAEILESMRQLGSPMYFEIAPNARVILDYLFPIEGQVLELITQEDGIAVHLTTSAAVHFLYQANPDFQQFLDALEVAKQLGTALLITTDMDEGNKIVDVRASLSSSG